MNKRGHRVQTQPLIPDVQNLIQKYRQFNLIPNRISVPIANASHHVYSYSPPVPPVPPVPSAPWRRAEPKLPNIVELRPHRSRRSAFDANNIASLIGVLAMLFIMGVVFTLFVNQFLIFFLSLSHPLSVNHFLFKIFFSFPSYYFVFTLFCIIFGYVPNTTQP